MKLKLLISFLLILLLSSCDNMFEFTDDIFFWPAGVDKNITKKTSVKPFSDLESPIVVAMPIFENHNLFGNYNLGHKVWQTGNILVVYDWSTDSIYDWAYTKGSCGWGDYQMVYVNGCWWTSGLDGTATKLNPDTGEISVFKHGIASRIQNHSAGGKYFLLEPDYRVGEEKGLYYNDIYFFNTEVNSIIGESWTFPYSSYDEYLENTYPLGDFKGNFWFCAYKDRKNMLCNLTPEGECMQILIENDEKNEHHLFSVELVSDDSVMVHAHDLVNDKNKDFPKMYEYNISDQKFEAVDISAITLADYDIFNGININGKTFFICLSGKFGENSRIAYYNHENKKLDFLDGVLAHNFTGWPYACGDRIYMLDWWNTQVLQYVWYDVETGEFSEPNIISLEDIISN